MPLQIGVGLSTLKDPILAAKEAALAARAQLYSDKTDLAIVFSCANLASETFLKTINIYSECAHLVGASGLGIISNKGILRSGVIVLLLNLAENMRLASACVKNIGAKPVWQSGEDLGGGLLLNFKNIRRNLGLIFSDGLIPNSSELIAGLQRRLGQSFPLIGASAADNLDFTKTYSYFGKEIIVKGASALLWGGAKLNFGLGTKHGWRPLGKPHIVTKSSGNVVNEIDGEPAAKIYEEYIGKKISEIKEQLKRISVFYPIGIKLAEENDFLLRNVFSIGRDNSLIFHGDVPENSSIRLMIGTKDTCLKAASDAAEEARKKLGNKPCKFILVFSSASRYILLGRHANKELDIIKEKFGADTPIVGMYTYGEQAPLKDLSFRGKTYFHNQTINILAIGG
ncbi:MAG: FIST N-terminal domain-containing protein [Candidatus Omnitrophota bacterium]